MPQPVPEPSESGAFQFAYQPALDGVRGVAVTLVLLFHGGFQWMSGGYVGVSVFFTLSGFLITSLLLLEHRRTGGVRWSAFVARRAKRLLPASLLCLLLISALAAMGEFAAVPHLRRDVLSAALQVANWNSLAGTDSYADLLSRSSGVQSPVEHFWSLAVEEQFYWVWPIVFLVLAKLAKRAGSMLLSLAALALAGVVGARLIALRWGADAAYWATPARLGEILVGAALAAGCLYWQQRPRWWGAFAAIGLAVVLWAAITWPSRGGPAYSGWFGVFSLASAALILGLQVEGPARRLFSASPLVWLGRISYGVYVFHWPVFVLVTPRTWSIDGWALFAIRMVITLAVSLLSYWLLEQPVRRSSWSSGRVAAAFVPAMAAAVAVVVAIVPAAPAPVSAGSAPVSSAPTVATTVTTEVTQVVAPPTTTQAGGTVAPTTTVAPGPISVLLIGDSTAQSLQPGLEAWAAAAPDRAFSSLARPGCGLVRGSSMLGDPSGVFREECEDTLGTDLPKVLAESKPDTVVIMVTIADVAPREWSSDEGMLDSSDDRYQERLRFDYRALVDELVAGGVRHIVWLVPPLPASGWLGWAAGSYTVESWGQSLPWIVALAGEYPTVSEVVRLDEWCRSSNLSEDAGLRADGLHFTDDGATRVVDEVVGPVLLRLASM